MVFDEYSIFDPLLVWTIIMLGHGRVDHDNVVLITVMQILDELSCLFNGEIFLVQRKDAPVIHVVNI